VAAVDANGGVGPASAAITITNGNATLSPTNYNWITFGWVVANTPHQWIIYSDKGLGGAYSCVGTSFTYGYSDFGIVLPCPPFAPATPPALATAQVLNTTISAGGGTSTLTLAASASNTATAQNVYHDESSFLNACVTDDENDRGAVGFPASVGAYGCYLPAGNYYLNGPLITDTTTPYAGGNIILAGSVFLNVFPWYVTKNAFKIQGVANSAQFNSFAHAMTTQIHLTPGIGVGFVLRGVNSVEIDNIQMSSYGHGIWVGQGVTTGAPSGFRFDNDVISANGAPLWIDNNVIGLWSTNSSFGANSSAIGLPSIYITGSNWNASTSCCMYFEGIASQFHGMKIDSPGGFFGGGGHNSIYIHNWIIEQLTSAETSLIVHDTGPNAPGAINPVSPLNNISVHNVNNSDPVNGPSAYSLFSELGTTVGYNGVDVTEANSFGSLLTCGPNTTLCLSPPGMAGTILNSSSVGGTWGGNLTVTPTFIDAGLPILSKLQFSSFGNNPIVPAWAQLLPPPNQFQVTGTGAGSLAAATYCMAVEGKDARATPGLTLPTYAVCQAVGASSSITLQWLEASGNLYQAYSGFRFVFCSTGGSSCAPNTYLDLPVGGSPYSYTFTSTSGGTAQGLVTNPNAYLSYLYWDRGSKSCLLCTSSAGGLLWQLGIGEGNPGAGVKLAVAGGTIQGEGGIQAGTDVAFNASPRGSYNAFLPNLTSAAATYQRVTLDKAITVTRFQLVLGTAGAGCTTQSTVSVTDGTNSVTLTTANGTAIYDSGAVSQNFAASANLDIKIATAASGCTTAPQNANVTAQYRMQ
jgi:hypothetical protein